MGLDLVALQPTKVPLFDHFDWASESEPEEPREFLSLQFGGKLSSDALVSDPDLAARFAPSGSALRAEFESLMCTLTAAPSSRSSHQGSDTLSWATSRERYQMLQKYPIGSFLAMAHFWIPSDSADSQGKFSEPVITVDAQSISTSTVWPAGQGPSPSWQLQPGGFSGPESSDWTILAGTVATSTRLTPQLGHHSWMDYRDLPGHV
jgi:hypothetical protein